MSPNNRTGCDEGELVNLYVQSRKRSAGSVFGFGHMEVTTGTDERRIVRMKQPPIVFDPDETQSAKPVNVVGLERAQRAISDQRPQVDELNAWRPLPTPRLLWRLITFFWSVVNGRK